MPNSVFRPTNFRPTRAPSPCLSILPILFLIIVCALSPAAFAAEGGLSSEEGIDAKKVYRQWCSQCHGANGEGDGINSTPDMSINPRDHTDALFMTTRTDEQFLDVINKGGASVAKSPLMPPWDATLDQEQIEALVAYLRKLCNCEFEGVVSHKKLRTVDTEFRQ